MEEKGRQPILVTGAHRTGTTWVGKMLAASGEAAYISEPLNVWHRVGVMRAPVHRWYTYLSTDNEAEFFPALQKTLSFRYGAQAELRSLRSSKDLLRMGRDWWIFLNGRLSRRIPLLKDPFAAFSAVWFAERLGCRVVFTIRHPAAFASSLKRLGWPFKFTDLLEQDLLMRDWLGPYREAMEKSLTTPEDVIGQASLLWKMIYTVLAQQLERHPEFIIIRHEDLSLDPAGGFERLYAMLGLSLTTRARDRILSSSRSENPKEVSKSRAYSVHLDSRANLQNWKRRLSLDEIERVRAIIGDVGERFYSDEEWD